MGKAEETTRRIAAGVDAARTQDPAAFADAVAGLATVDLEIVGTVEASVIRELIEESHPAGLTGDDVRAALERTIRTTTSWWPDVAVSDLIAVYTAALGMTDPDAPAGDRAALALHGLLVIADLVAPATPADASTPASTPADEVLTRHLHSALAEIYRAETVELP